MTGTREQELLRRALKAHDAIAAGLRTGMRSQRTLKAIDEMITVKKEAVAIGCYPPSIRDIPS